MAKQEDIHVKQRETESLRPIQHDRGKEWMEPERQQEIIDYIYEHPNSSCRFVADALGIASHVSVWHVLRRENLHPFRYQTIQGGYHTTFFPCEYPP